MIVIITTWMLYMIVALKFRMFSSCNNANGNKREIDDFTNLQIMLVNKDILNVLFHYIWELKKIKIANY